MNPLWIALVGAVCLLHATNAKTVWPAPVEFSYGSDHVSVSPTMFRFVLTGY